MATVPTVKTHFDDVSHYQDNFQPTRATVCKATESNNFIDPTFGPVQKRCAVGGHHFMGYGFMHESGPGHPSEAQQAAFMLSVVKKVPGMLDIESEGKSHPTLTDVVNFVVAYRKGGGIMNMIYLPHWYWREFWGSCSLAPLARLGLHNINSDYTAGENNLAAMADFGGLDVCALQYTSKPWDMDVAYMPWDDLAKLWGFTDTAAPKPPAISPPLGSRLLKLASPNMRGGDVKWMQAHIGPRCGTPDGVFGPNTKSGVIWWQQQHRLAADGEVGRNTWASMGVKYTGA